MSLKQVIVIRKDLGMRRGKEIAQGAHASMAWLTHRLTNRANFKEDNVWRATGFFSDVEHEWMTSGFRKICCVVQSEQDLLDLVQAAKEAGVMVELIKDAGATEFGGVPTYTAAAFGPDTDEKLDPITGYLTLY